MINKTYDINGSQWMVLPVIFFVFMVYGSFVQHSSELKRPAIKDRITSGDDWITLTDTSKWRSTNNKEFPDHGWSLTDGVLSFAPMENGHGGDIITKEKYLHFELSLEFKIEKGGNSGIKYKVVDDYPGHTGNYLGLEYQLIDDERHPDAQKGRSGNRKLASLYDMISTSKKKVNMPGEWNAARIVVDGNQCEHWLNGDKVVAYRLGSPEYKKLVEQSKYHIYENFGEVGKGHILLQAHGDSVSFRNIKVRKLSGT